MQPPLEYAARAEQAGEDIVRFNPGDLGTWVYLVRAHGGVGQRALRSRAACATRLPSSSPIAALADDDRLTPSARGDVGVDLVLSSRSCSWRSDMRAAAERTLSRRQQATEEGAAQFAEDSPRRRMTLGRPRAERAWLALRRAISRPRYDELPAVVRRSTR